MHRMKKYSLLLFLLLISSPVYAAVCFDANTAGRMVVDLEQCKISSQELEIQTALIGFCQDQVKEYQATVKDYDSTVKGLQETIKGYQAVSDKQEKLSSAPSFFQRIIDNIELIGLAVLIGLLL